MISAKISNFYDVKAEASKKDLKDNRETTKEEYIALLALLRTFLEDFYNNPTLYMTHTELMEKRAIYALNHAFNGYGMTFVQAMDIVKLESTEGLSADEIAQRTMLVGLVDNLVNFSVAAEHNCLMAIAEDRKNSNDFEEFSILAEKTFKRFNSVYAGVENEDIFFAMGLAAEWMRVDAEQIMQFTTQGDERVRDSHEAINGLKYRKKDFPEALVPPIDHGCRCFLIETGTTDGRTLTNKPNVDKLIESATNAAFKYNVAIGGKMFSEEHPYFDIESKYDTILNSSVTKIKNNLGL